MAERTIDLTIQTHPIMREAIASGSITPGMLLRKQSTGKMLACAVASERIQAAVAVENKLYGKEIDTAYASGDRVFFKVFRAGDFVYMWLAIGAAAVVIGDKLVPDTAGCLKKETSNTTTPGGDEEHVMFQAEEAEDNSSATDPARIVVSVI